MARGIELFVEVVVGVERILAPQLAAVMERVGENVAEDMRDHVPVVTGRLQRAIGVEMSGTTAIVGPDPTAVDYAVPVELGHGFADPQPYMRPALDRLQRHVNEAAR